MTLPIQPENWPVGQAETCRDWDDHEFVQKYYGHECAYCGLFFAHGCAPWEETWED